MVQPISMWSILHSLCTSEEESVPLGFDHVPLIWCKGLMVVFPPLMGCDMRSSAIQWLMNFAYCRGKVLLRCRPFADDILVFELRVSDTITRRRRVDLQTFGDSIGILSYRMMFSLYKGSSEVLTKQPRLDGISIQQSVEAVCQLHDLVLTHEQTAVRLNFEQGPIFQAVIRMKSLNEFLALLFDRVGGGEELIYRLFKKRPFRIWLSHPFGCFVTEFYLESCHRHRGW